MSIPVDFRAYPVLPGSFIVSFMQSDPFNELFPDLPESEIARSRENLDHYLELVSEIWEELRAQEAMALTDDGRIPTIKEKVE